MGRNQILAQTACRDSFFSRTPLRSWDLLHTLQSFLDWHGQCYGAKPPSRAVLSFVAFPSSTAECNSPNAFHPPGELDKDQAHPDRGPRFLCSEAFSCSSLLASGPSQVRICLGLVPGKEVGSEGQFLISPHRLDSAAAATAASRSCWIGENCFSDSLPFSPPFFSLPQPFSPSLSLHLPPLYPRCPIRGASHREAQARWVEVAGVPGKPWRGRPR